MLVLIINDNVMLSADLAVIFFKYQTSFSSINRSSNGLLTLLLKVSAMWTYLSVVLMLLCPISSFTILMSVPCSSKWVAIEWRSRCGYIRFVIPASRAAAFSRFDTILSVKGSSGLRSNNHILGLYNLLYSFSFFINGFDSRV